MPFPQSISSRLHSQNVPHLPRQDTDLERWVTPAARLTAGPAPSSSLQLGDQLLPDFFRNPGNLQAEMHQKPLESFHRPSTFCSWDLGPLQG